MWSTPTIRDVQKELCSAMLFEESQIRSDKLIPINVNHLDQYQSSNHFHTWKKIIITPMIFTPSIKADHIYLSHIILTVCMDEKALAGNIISSVQQVSNSMTFAVVKSYWPGSGHSLQSIEYDCMSVCVNQAVLIHFGKSHLP